MARTVAQKLSHHWRKRSRIPWSTWDALDPERRALALEAGQGRLLRRLPLDLNDGSQTVAALTRDLWELVWRGYPLTFEEFHLAVALRYILTELPHESFYRFRWYETADEFGYGAVPNRRRRRSARAT